MLNRRPLNDSPRKTRKTHSLLQCELTLVLWILYSQYCCASRYLYFQYCFKYITKIVAYKTIFFSNVHRTLSHKNNGMVLVTSRIQVNIQTVKVIT